MFDWPSALKEIKEMERNGVPSSWFIEICQIIDPDHPRQANRVVFKKDDKIGYLTLLQYAQRFGMQCGVRNVNLMDYKLINGLPVSNNEDEIIVTFDKEGKAALVLDEMDHGKTGRMLGIPDCCVDSFVDLAPYGIDEYDVRWRQGAIDDAIARNRFDFHWAYNPKKSFMRFVPCKFDCENAYNAIKEYLPPSHPTLTPWYESMEIQGHTFNFTLDTLT